MIEMTVPPARTDQAGHSVAAAATGTLKTPENKGQFHYLQCKCGNELPVLRTKFPQLLSASGLPDGTLPEDIVAQACPSCAEVPGKLVKKEA